MVFWYYTIDSYTIYPKLEANGVPPANLSWIPVKSTKGHKLEIGDKIKLGRQVLKVLEIVTEKPHEQVLFPSSYVFSIIFLANR